ncbi:unnamed protein product, partial [Mesorhabditis belari]|uniref:Abnormal cell migration protein 18-like fibronectin type I domain-containing protein n=1 Tax=Mesorhabditis belari TaxID=2138241 RepID=A0AAF3EGT4_9BILA
MLAPRERQRFLMWFIFGIFIAGILGETIEKTIILHGNEDLAKVLEEAMPKRCYKDGKDYAEGEAFQGGHLRYRCQKFGVYVIEGCRTDGGKDLDVGDRVLEENLLSQCFKEGNSIFFRQTVCGIIGMPACDKITPDSPLLGVAGMQEVGSVSRTISTQVGSPSTLEDSPGLPYGWHIVGKFSENKMALYISQFAQLPHAIKALTFILSLCLTLCLIIAPSASGSFLVWLTLLISFLLNLSAAAILLFELENIVFPLFRTVSYSMTESLGALLLVILHFVSLWLCFNAKTYTSSFAWTVAAGICLLQSFAYAFDFFQYFREWLREQREAANRLHVESPTSYGLP